MKTTTTIATLFLAVTAAAHAIPIGTVDLGPHRIALPTDNFHSPVSKIGLSGTPLDGQAISFEIAFASGQFVRAFTTTTFFWIDLTLPLDGTVPLPEQNHVLAAGTGYFLDVNGNAVGSPVNIEAYFDSLVYPFMATDVQLVSFLSVNIPRPVDLYGFHFDFAFSLPGASIQENGPFSNNESLDIGANHVYGIGPRVRGDIVPESANTLLLLSCACGVLLVLSRRQMRGTAK